MLKTFILLIFMKLWDIHDSLSWKLKKNKNKKINRIHVFTVTVDTFNTSFLSKSISWLIFQQLAKQNYCVVSSVCRKHKNLLVIVRKPITRWTPLLIYIRLFYSFCEDGPPSPPQAATLITSTGPQTHNGEKTQKEMKTQAMCYSGFSAFWT